MIDLSRLTSDERELFDEFYPEGLEQGVVNEGPGFRLWSFGAICAFELGHVPKVVVEKMDEIGISDQPMRYLENMRMKIEAERRKAG